MPLRAWAALFAEGIIIGFFALLAYTGYEVLVVLEGEYLVSLTWIPIQLTQSVIPIGATLFVLCEILSFPDYFKKTCAGISLEHAEIEEEVETELAKSGGQVMIVFMMFVILVALICINVPIAVGLAVSAIFGLAVTEGLDSIVTLALDMYDGSTKFSLIAIPMFVLAGAIMNAGGITDKLINFVNAIIGFVRGGLAMVNIGVSLFFAEISGSAVADVAALGSVLIPQMKKRGYSAPLAAAVTSSSASLAIIIPPSIPMILYATSAGTSVEQLFVAGIIPGLLGAFGLMGMALFCAQI